MKLDKPVATIESLKRLIQKSDDRYAIKSDLAKVATSGSYTDLSNKPTSIKNPNSITFTGGVTGTYDGSAAKTVNIPTTLPANGGNASTVNGLTVETAVPKNAKFTDTWRGIQNNLTSTSTSDSLSAAQGKWLDENKTNQTNWNAVIKCATWSRICYIANASSITGSTFLLNVSATRANVVYNETFCISVNHSQKSSIVKIGTAKYSIIQIRVVSNSDGSCYIELYDNAENATNTTTQTVVCKLVGVRTGAVTAYTVFTNGSTLPTNFVVSSSLTVNGNSLQGNLTWGEITGKPSTFTPASHTHSYAGSSSAGGAATSANKLNTNAGSASSPVYFSNGVPVACTSISVATVTATTTLNIPGGKIWIE